MRLGSGCVDLKFEFEQNVVAYTVVTDRDFPSSATATATADTTRTVTMVVVVALVLHLNH